MERIMSETAEFIVDVMSRLIRTERSAGNETGFEKH